MILLPCFVLCIDIVATTNQNRKSKFIVESVWVRFWEWEEWDNLESEEIWNFKIVVKICSLNENCSQIDKISPFKSEIWALMLLHALMRSEREISTTLKNFADSHPGEPTKKRSQKYENRETKNKRSFDNSEKKKTSFENLAHPFPLTQIWNLKTSPHTCSWGGGI